MLTGAIDFGGFASGLGHLARPSLSQYQTEVKPKPKYQATLDLNEILDDEDEDEEQSIASHLEHIEQNINNITELVLQFQIIIEEDILNERTLNLASDNFLMEFLDMHFQMFKLYKDSNTKTQMLHLHVLNSVTRLYELEPEMIQKAHVDVLIPLCMEKMKNHI